ncbi:hypothetical protein [Nocardiopsis sp. L17-MgMaSL7]|uniref:hypothetical protein n=1 Tax=Nocardiopsis sp. L17-MgMaSL7 TaxID=1938893 RepID=UPI000D70BC9A|nr:hypothetical protein [Nocardiopsis sp. L17-MgMaSL7]PWV44611.1 hypothetical protein BDW27_12370 [Nocardiopsis sp. L17-MgMaSL7]
MTLLTDDDAWILGYRIGVQVMYRARLAALTERGVGARLDVCPGVPDDVLLIVLSWQLWDQGRGRPEAQHPGVDGLDLEWPTEVPAAATDYDRMLLERVLEASEEERVRVRIGVRLALLGDADIISQGRDVPEDGKIRVLTIFSGRLVVPDDHGDDRSVVCPVCGRGEGLEVGWDGVAATAQCPSGHGRWVLPTVTESWWRGWQDRARPIGT